MGGYIALPESEEHFHTQMDYAEGLVKGEYHEKCVHSSGSLIYWLGYTDQFEEGVWMNPYSKEPMTFEGNWEPGNPNGGAAENCARTYIDRRPLPSSSHAKSKLYCGPNSPTASIFYGI